jgi:hypothetical protein
MGIERDRAAAGTAPDPARTERWRDLGAFGACAVITFLAFASTLGHDFAVTWDDGIYVLSNESIRELSLRSLWAALTSLRHLWAPLTWLSYTVDHAIWGLAPFGYHLTNVVCHALTAGMVFLLARELIGAGSPGLPRGALRALALVAALAWALHPLRTESVAWVTERKDVLSALLGIPAVLAYLRYARDPARPSWRSMGFARVLLLYVLALSAKSSLATVPLVLLLLDWYPLRRLGAVETRGLLLEKAILLVPAGLVTWLTTLSLAGSGPTLQESGLVSRVLIALRATWEYLRLSVWPAGLSPFYLNPLQADPLDPAFLLPAIAVLALTVAAAALARRRPALTAAWLGYLVLLAPALAATQTADTGMADRFTYLPSIPLTVLAAAGLGAVLARHASRAALAAAGSGVALLLAALATLTARQNTCWRDDVAIWTRAIDVRPHFSGRVYFQRATAYELREAWPEALADMDEAVTIASRRRYGRMQDLYGKRAHIHARLGDLGAAADDLTRALEMEQALPARAQLRRDLAEVLQAGGLGDLAAEQRRLADSPTP